MQKVRISVLLAGAALLALSAPGFAAAKKVAPPPLPDPRIGVLEQQLRDVQQQLAEIKGSQRQPDYSAPVRDLKAGTSDQYAEITNRVNAMPKAAVDNG